MNGYYPKALQKNHGLECRSVDRLYSAPICELEIYCEDLPEEFPPPPRYSAPVFAYVSTVCAQAIYILIPILLPQNDALTESLKGSCIWTHPQLITLLCGLWLCMSSP